MFFPRRDFLKRAALGMSAAATYGATEIIADDKKPVSKSPNEKLGVAIVGCGGRGGEHVDQWADSKKNTEILYLCDADTQAGGGKLKSVAAKQNREPLYVQDFRRALEDPAVDLVSIATPNHWHSLHAILALQAGKDVYVEKPVSHNVWEGRQIVNWARKLNRLCQCGTQSRSSPSLKEAHKWIHEGNLGAIKYAVGTCYKPRASIGKLDKPLVIPENIDYDLWCGPAAKVDLYRPRLHYDWHWDWNTGNGDMGNQGIHQMDISRWFLNENELSPEILSIGGRLGYDDAGNTPNTQTVIHLYEKAPLIFETRGLPKDKASQKEGQWGTNDMDNYKGSRVGVLVFCEQGVLVIPSYTAVAAFDYDGKQIKEWKGGGEHFANLADAIRSGNQSLLNGEILEGHLSSALCHTGGLSHQLGRPATAKEVAQEVASHDLFADSFDRMAAHLRKNEVDIDNTPALTLGVRLKMDPKTETFTNSTEANKMLTREYRAGYVVPDGKA
jgi:predicted dehydrogenase